jgi:DNA-binding PadR family transcriptional regulator
MGGNVSIANSKPLGDAATSILAVLVARRRHGYGIIAEVRGLSGRRVRLRTGTLDGALARLQESGLVAESGDETIDGRGYGASSDCGLVRRRGYLSYRFLSEKLPMRWHRWMLDDVAVWVGL